MTIIRRMLSAVRRSVTRPLTTPDEDADYLFFKTAVDELRAEKADGPKVRQLPASIHRPAIYLDENGQTVVHDRWGTRIDGVDIAYPATEIEVQP